MRLRSALYVSTLLAAVAALAACGGSDKQEPAPSSGSSSASSGPASPAAKTFDPSTAVVLKGRVLFQGTPPPREELPIRGNPECAVFHAGGSVLSEKVLVQDGGLQNVFVYVKEGLEGYRFQAPPAPVTVSNKQCVYVPHVVGVQVGQPVDLLNEDATLHNIHSYSKANKAFNLGLPFQGMKQTKKFTAPEIMVQLKCDVHPWMIGYLGVVGHPCFAVSAAGGGYEIRDLPPGKYVIEAWHEVYGTSTRTIEVAAGQPVQLDFTFQGA